MPPNLIQNDWNIKYGNQLMFGLYTQQHIPVTLWIFLYQLKYFTEKLYAKEDTSKTTTSEVFSKISMRKNFLKQHLSFAWLTDLDIMTFVFLSRSY